MTHNDDRRRELAHFLRTRRERMSPVQAGLSVGGRRRTPGLRREEIAQLAGVSVSWYTWLEQERDITPSPQVLDSIVRVLQLNSVERAHLFVLARGHPPDTTLPEPACVSAATQQILDALAPCPAYIVDSTFTIIAWNETARRVFVDFAAMPCHERNLVWIIFAHPPARGLYVDWVGEAQRTLALFRASSQAYIGEPWFTQFIDRLEAASAEFRAWWPRYDVLGTYVAQKELQHPQVGQLFVQPTMLSLAHASAQRMVVYTPAPGTDTAEKFRRLTVETTAVVS
jgi:transcriptional regulator with XRE-family HTH domain